MLGKIIRSPTLWDNCTDNRKSVFLAGGTTNCENWQNSVSEKIANSLDVVVLDPRRDLSNSDDHLGDIIQASWECKHLKKSNHILFWFPSTSDCSTTLFELGVYLAKDIPMSIGTDSRYTHRFEVEVQSILVRPCVTIWHDLDRMVDNLIGELLVSKETPI